MDLNNNLLLIYIHIVYITNNFYKYSFPGLFVHKAYDFRVVFYFIYVIYSVYK